MPFILLSIILSLLLVMAGDVEPNPQAHLENVHIGNLRFQYAQKKCEHCGLLVKSVKSNQKKLSQNTQYQENAVMILAKKVESYKSNPEKQQALSKSSYRANPEALSQQNYRANTDKYKALFKMNYRDKLKALFKLNYAKKRDARIKSFKTYYTDNIPINWLYKNVDDESVDEAAKQVVEVISNTSSTMLEKATKEDIVGFQAYTIRNLDNKLSTE